MTDERTSSGFSDIGLLLVIGGVTLVGGLVWLWGEIAGALFGRGLPGVGPGEAVGVLTRLPARVSDPATAWPAAVRRQLPGAGGFYASLGFSVVGRSPTDASGRPFPLLHMTRGAPR